MNVKNNALIEGVEDLKLGDDQDPGQADAGKGSVVVTDYAGETKKGYAPYNPRKKNQDALAM